jgi:hypothetical protein
MINKNRFIDEIYCQKTDRKRRTKYFYITYLNCNDINTFRNITINIKEYSLTYMCAKLEITPNKIPYVQAYIQFNKKIPASKVYAIYNKNCRVIKAESFDKESFLLYTINNQFEEFGRSINQKRYVFLDDKDDLKYECYKDLLTEKDIEDIRVIREQNEKEIGVIRERFEKEIDVIQKQEDKEIFAIREQNEEEMEMIRKQEEKEIRVVRNRGNRVVDDIVSKITWGLMTVL